MFKCMMFTFDCGKKLSESYHFVRGRLIIAIDLIGCVVHGKEEEEEKNIRKYTQTKRLG